jgi:hypothetical protein
MSFDWGALAQGATGVLGLLGAGQANSAANSYYSSAADLNKRRSDALKYYLDQAQAYNPAAEAQVAIGEANNRAGFTLNKSLGELRNRFAVGGGDAGGDTAFNVSAQNETNRVMDPLKLWTAQTLSNATAQKLQALGQAVGAGGDITGDYLGLAQGSKVDPSGALGILGSSLDKLFPQKGTSKGVSGVK